MSSDSESSDSENSKQQRTDKNTSQSDDRVENGPEHSKMLSPLAKRNSTLTSLLNSSATKNDSSYRNVSSSPTKGFSQPDSSNDYNDINDDKDTNDKYGLLEKPEKRNTIMFSFKKKNDKMEGRENGDLNDRLKSRYKQVGVATPYYVNDSQKSNGDRDNSEDRINTDINTNGLTNGLSKSNCVYNGNRKPVPNGWVVTEIENESVDNENPDRTQNRGSSKNDWVVTDKSNRNSSS